MLKESQHEGEQIMTELHLKNTKMIYIFQHTLKLTLFSIKILQGIKHPAVQYVTLK